MRVLLATPHEPSGDGVEVENGQCRDDIRDGTEEPLHDDKRVQGRAWSEGRPTGRGVRSGSLRSFARRRAHYVPAYQ